MTRVLWGDAGTRFFETGVDRGVLYLSDQDGVAWNGLTSVEESPSGGEAKPYYQDGIKYLNVSAREEFEATIEAFSAPAEFGPCDGTVLIQNGLFVGQQPRRAFSLSYRTMIGNDLDPQMGYKLHLVYNALASPSSRTNATMSDSPEAQTLSWSLTTLPPAFTGYKPTAHFVIDSRKTPRGLLAAIEDILYGSDVADARIPMPSELISMFKSEGPTTRKNFALNPSFRTSSGSIEVRRNLVANPSYANPLALAEVRRNLATNPGAETTSGWLSNNTNAWTMSQDSAVKASGTYSMKSTPSATTIGTSKTLGSIYSVGGITIPASPNDIITVSVGVAHNAVGNADANIFVQFLDGASAIVGTQNQGVLVSIGGPGTTFTRVKYTTTAAPAGTVGIRVLCNVQKAAASTNVAANEFCWYDECLIEKASAMLPYFDGSTANVTLTHTWVGAANASASIASGPQPVLASFRGYNRTSWVVLGGASDGSNSVRSFMASSTTPSLPPSTLLLFNIDTPPMVPNDVGVGRFRARMLNATTPVVLNTRMYAYGSAGAISPGAIGTVTLPVDGSWVDVVAPSFVAPAGTTNMRLYATVVSGDTLTANIIETSNVLIEKADVAMPWFDGNTAAADGLTYSWSGTAGNSAAIAVGKAVSGFGLSSNVKAWQGSDGMSARLLRLSGSSGFAEISSTVSTPVTAGDIVSFAVDAYSDSAASLVLGYASIGSPDAGTSTATDTGPGGSTMSITTAPMSAGSTSVRQLYIPKTSGVVFTLRNNLSEKAPSNGPFFDGSMLDTDNYFYYWDGAPDASTSHVNTWN